MIASVDIVHKKLANKNHYGWYVPLIVLILCHIGMVYHLSVNMPYLDDYTFLIDILHLKSVQFTIPEVVSTLLTPHGPHTEHMLVFGRLTAILDYLIEGELNFRTLFFVGNATLIATVLLLYHIGRRAGLSVAQITPVAVLFFQPQYYENTTTWAICALQHVPALFLAFLTFHLLSRPSGTAFFFSFPIAFLGTFSNGNGIAVLVAGFLILLISWQGIRLAIWSVFSVLAIGAYYYLTHVNHSPADTTNLSHPFRVLGGFFLISGSMGVLFTRSLVVISLLGIMITVLLASVIILLLSKIMGFAYVLRYLPVTVQKRLAKWTLTPKQTAVLPLAGGYIYLILTILGIAFARSIGWHYALLLPRSIWFATVLIVVGYLLMMTWLRPVYRLRVSWVVLVISLVFSLTSYGYNLDEVMNVRKSLLSDLHNWRESELLITMPPGRRFYDQKYGVILREAIKQAVYVLPKAEFEPIISNPAIPVNEHLNLVEKDSIFPQSERLHERLTLARKALPVKKPGSEGAYLLLRSEQHTFVWPVDQSAQKLAQFLVNGGPTLSGNIATIFVDMLPETTYRVGVLYQQNDQWQAQYSLALIQVKHPARTGD